jgi:hypothetical protein
MTKMCVRQILPSVSEFKLFWKEKGPFGYALTSLDYPPILLDPEAWIFGNSPEAVLKELMQFDRQKMAFVQAPFNLKNKQILRPETLSSWKITHFPEQWNGFVSDIFVPEGHLTCVVTTLAQTLVQTGQALDEKAGVEQAFFTLLEKRLPEMGYQLLSPRGHAAYAFTKDYLAEWEQDEKDAGLL